MGVFLIFDLIILILLVVFAVRGAHRGLVLSLCGLVAVVVAFAGAGIAARTLSPMVADALEPRFAAAIEKRLDESIADSKPQETLPPEETDGGAGTQADDPLHDVLDALRDMGLYENLINTIDHAVEQGMTEVAASAAAKAAAAMAQSVAYLALFLLAFVLILLLWRLVSHALDLVARLPGLHFLNKTLGAAFGLVQCCIVLFIAAWLIQFLGNFIPEEAVEQTYLLRFFMATNPFSLLSGLN